MFKLGENSAHSRGRISAIYYGNKSPPAIEQQFQIKLVTVILVLLIYVRMYVYVCVSLLLLF